MPEISIVVLLDKEQKDKIAAIAEKLGSEGMRVEQTMSTVGIISGKAEAATLEALRKVEGVAQLREEGVFQVPPMDENIPQ